MIHTSAEPVSYQQWLDCLAQLREHPQSGSEELERISQENFSTTGTVEAALEQQIVYTVNTVLDKVSKRFICELNQCLAFGELPEMELLFKRFRRNVNRSLFFRNLTFLPDAFRAELFEKVRVQMETFLKKVLQFLHTEAVRSGSQELEDTLFLIRRVRLFT